MKNVLIVLGLALMTLACSGANTVNPTPTTHSYNITCESSNYASSSSSPVHVTWSTSTGLSGTIQCTFAASGLTSNISLQSTDVINITVSGNSFGFSNIYERPAVGPSTAVATVTYPNTSGYVVPY